MRALVDLLDEHGSAIEYDLIRHGSRLRDFPDGGVSWRDLLVLVQEGQKDSTSALWRSLNPDWQWGPAEMLQALMVDEIRYLQYLYTVQNFKGHHKPPRPIPRPGVEDPTDSETIGGGRDNSLPMDEMAEWLGGAFAALNN